MRVHPYPEIVGVVYAVCEPIARGFSVLFKGGKYGGNHAANVAISTFIPLREQEAVGSNPVSPTNKTLGISTFPRVFYFFENVSNWQKRVETCGNFGLKVETLVETFSC